MGGQRGSNKEQEPSLAAHSEQLKTKNADRQTEKRGSNGRARRVYCKLAKAREGGGESRAGEEKAGRQEGEGREGRGGRGGAAPAGRRIRWRVLEVTPKTPGPVASADIEC